MTTQELKSYIDRILGNNIRLLLPSYWWKRAFGAVIDKIEESSGVRIVGSTSELENLEVPVGSLASVAGDIQSLSECYLVHSMDELENTHFSTLTKVTGIKFSAPVTADFIMLVGGEDNNIMFLAEAAANSLGAFLSEPTSESEETPLGHLVTIINQGEIDMDAVAAINHFLAVHDSHYLISSGNDGYNTPALLSQIDKMIKLTGDAVSADTYIKGETWTRLLKEGDVTDAEIVVYADEVSQRNADAFYKIKELAEKGLPITNVVVVDGVAYSAAVTYDEMTMNGVGSGVYIVMAQYAPIDTNPTRTIVTPRVLMLGINKDTGEGAANIIIRGGIDSSLSDTSENPVQNKVVTEALNEKANITYVDEKIPDMEGVVKAVDTSETIDDAEFKGYVQYDFQQSLTSEQKQQARTNIGVDEAIASAVTNVLNNPV